MNNYVFILIFVLFETSTPCPRDRSRIVRDVIEHKIKPVYKKMNVAIPRSCAFYTERDIYYYQEAHKTEESYGKWYCDFCGKGFYAEGYLDLHLHNRHADQLYVRVFNNCIPPGLDFEERTLLINKTKFQICSFLTCNRYWDTGYIDESQWQMLLKTFLTVFLISGMIIYYFLAYHHFYDEALFERERPEPFKPYLAKPVPRRKVRKKYIYTDPT